MESLHNELKNNVPKAEPCSLLCSNTDVMHGSAFGLIDKEPPIESLLEQLAEIIIEVYFYDRNNTTKQ